MKRFLATIVVAAAILVSPASIYAQNTMPARPLVEQNAANLPDPKFSDTPFVADSSENRTLEALSSLQRRAEVGDAIAQNNLGYRYTYGRGVAQDYSEALRWYEKAASQGLSAAQYNLGAFFEHGLGVTQDFSKAASYYLAAALQSHTLAQARLGYLYETGDGVILSPSEAMKWYRLAAQHGDASAECKLAYGYYAGRGVRRDYGKLPRGSAKRPNWAWRKHKIIWELSITMA